MPYVIICPECNAQLKSNTLIPAGKTIVCPSCKTKFTTEKDSKEIGAPSPKAASSPPAGTPARSKARPTEEDEDFEDTPKKSKKKKQNDEDFEDEDFEETPKKSKKKKQNDEDFEDEDFEDTPKKSKKKKKSSYLPLIIALGSVFLLCGGCGITSLILYLTDNFPFLSSSGGSAYKEMTKYVPNDAEMVMLMNFKTLLNDSVLGKRIKADVDKDKSGPLTKVGLIPEDVEKAVVVELKQNPIGGPKGGSANQELSILKLSKSVNVTDYAAKLNAKEMMFNNQKYYKSPKDEAFFVAGSNILIVGNESGVQAALGASTQTPNENMKKLLSQADGDLVQIQPNPKVSLIPLDVILLFSGGVVGGNPFGGNSPKDATPQSIVTTHKLKSDTIVISNIINYADESTAKAETEKRNAKLETARTNLPNLEANLKKIGGAVPMSEIENVAKMIKSASVSNKGSTMILTFEIPKTEKGFDSLMR